MDATLQKIANILEEILKRTNSDQSDNYMICDQETIGSINYYGFTNSNGNWYVLKNDESNGSYRYCSNNTDYITAWNKRLTLTYDYPHNIQFNK